MGLRFVHAVYYNVQVPVKGISDIVLYPARPQESSPTMRRITAFYAWQSDTPRKFNRDLIDIALRGRCQTHHRRSLRRCRGAHRFGYGRPPGISPITETILKKIESCDIFVPDVTFVAHTEGGKLIPNPNVMTEFGYALSVKKHAGIMPVMNAAFGPPKELPFDMGHLRHPIQYSVEPTAKAPTVARSEMHFQKRSRKNYGFR